MFKGFTAQYGCKRLVWYEMHHDREGAFARERELKRWKRVWKITLIEKRNPHWDDLSVRLSEDNLYDEACSFEA